MKIREMSRIMVLAAFAIVLVGCFDTSAEQFLKNAKANIGKKDSAAAIIQLKNALQKNPSLAEARFLLGQTLLAGGDPVGAAIELQKARELGYENDALVPLQAKVLLLTGTPDKVIAAFGDKAPRSAAAQSELQAVLAVAYQALAKTEQAEAAIAVALQADPGNIAAQLFQIRLRISAGGVGGMVEAVDKVIAVAPANSEAWKLKGDILHVEGKPDQALAAYREAITRDKTNLSAHGTAVWLLIDRKDIPAAEAQLQGLRVVFPSLPQTKFLTAMIALDKGDLKSAAEQAQQLLKQSPDSMSALQLDGAVALRTGSLVRAEASLSKALQIAPDNVRVRLLLAQAQLRRGDTAKVVKLLQTSADSAGAPWESTVLLAQALLVSGDVERAGKYFAKAAKLDPTDARSRTALALAQIDKGRLNEGLDELKSISSTDPGNTADLALINVQWKKKDLNGALASIGQLEKKQPDQPVAAYLRGQTQLLIGDRQKARTAFEDAVKIESKYFPAAAALAAMDVADGEPDLARQRFARMMKGDPADNRPAMALVEVMAQFGATKEELVDTLTQIIKNDPAAAAPRIKLIALQIEKKNYKEAVAVAQQGLGFIPDNTDLLDMLAQAQYLSGDVNQALASYNKIASLQPNSPVPFVNMAEVHLLQMDLAAAKQDLRHALSVKPDYFPAHRALIDLELSAGRLSNALAMVQALQKQPSNAVAALMLEGDIYASKKQWTDAARVYRTSLEKQPAPASAIKWHRALMAAGLSAEANKAEAQWLKAHRDEPSFLYYLGDLAMAKADYALARQRYADVLKAAPDNPLALNNLAWLLGRDKNPDALTYALKANKVAPKTPAFMDTLAEIYAGAGQVPKAVETQLGAVTLAPDSPDLRMRLAKYYVLVNEKAKAKEQLGRLAALGDKFSGQAEVQAMLSQL